MIEKVIIEYLRNVLSMNEVYAEKPEDRPSKYVIIEKTGSGKKNRIESSTIAIQSVACSLYEAARLNERIKDAMDNILVLNNISSSRLNTDYNYTNTATKEYRYQAVYELVHD